MATRHSMVALLAVAGLLAGSNAGAELIKRRVSPVQPVLATAAVAGNRLAVFRSVVAGARLTPQAAAQAEASFSSAPLGAQDALLAAYKPGYAAQMKMVEPIKLIRLDLSKLLMLKPRIDAIYPAEGNRGTWAVIDGFGLKDTYKVWFNGAMPTQCFAWNHLLFQVPANAALGANAQVYVKDPANAQVVSSVFHYKVVAPRGYRGVHGFKFPNFGTPAFTWAVYRDYFGANEVEYANGTHRPAADAYFHSTYKGVGGGGDCYGFSLRSVRARRHDWRSNHAAWWAANQQPTVWDYAKVEPQVCDSIRWDQGSWLAAQSLAVTNDRWNHQTHMQAFNVLTAALATGDSNKQPIVVFWNPSGGGHAVVGYDSKVVGNDHQIVIYDNNKPYAENETSDNNSLCHVYSNNNTFQYGSYNKMMVLRFDEMNHADPHLPAEAGGAPNAAGDLMVLACDSPNGIAQVTDDAGRRFFVNGQQNMDPATRIPDSMLLLPPTGGPRPADAPQLLVFGKCRGKNLTVELSGRAPCTLRSFAPGRVSTISARAGKLKLLKLAQPDHAVELAEPGSMGLTRLELIAVQPDRSERLFDVTPAGLDRGTLRFGLDAGATGIIIDNATPKVLGGKLLIRSFSPAGAVQENLLPALGVPAGKAGQLRVGDFNQLKQLKLKLDVR